MENLAYLLGPGLAGTLIDLFGVNVGALEDLAEDSQAIALLNSAAYQENDGSNRRAFYSIMTSGYVGHEFAFIPGMTEEAADYYGNLMVNDGFWTYFAGVQLELAGGLAGNYSMVGVGHVIMELGDMEYFYWQWWAWNVVQGHTGFYSDGVVSGYSQQGWPDGINGLVQSEQLGVRFHTNETKGLAAELRQKANQIFGH